jgi:hypothetical protein
LKSGQVLKPGKAKKASKQKSYQIKPATRKIKNSSVSFTHMKIERALTSPSTCAATCVKHMHYDMAQQKLFKYSVHQDKQRRDDKKKE